VKLSPRTRDFLVVIGWALILSSIILQSLYIREFLTFMDLLALFFASVFAGVILVDAERILYGFVGVIVLCLLLVFLCLTLPIALGKLQSADLAQALYGATLIMIFRSMLATATPVVVLIGGLVGGALGEWMRFR